MPWTTSDLETIRAARLRGVRTVQFSDRSVTYATDAEMRKVEEDIRAELAGVAGRRKQSTIVGSKGFC